MKTLVLVFCVLLCLAQLLLVQTNFHRFLEKPVITENVICTFTPEKIWHHSVLYDQGVYKMWYTLTNEDDSKNEFGYAESTDKINWRLS